ncbi:36547_t:CDS:2 [Gigaspora margarita]|uniref:36547_t:CDS:1 n=1 Tax=Gigaspora margarita TaxID=4874 RepID=A0ABM8VXT5_GIGMA|nr:36547_t:CDS:2 [Gigaspora margarita]
MDEIIESGHGYEGSLSISHDENHNNRYDRLGMIYNINNIIGCGIFVIPGDVWRLIRSPGAALILWLIGGVFSFLSSLVFHELGMMFPRAGELQYIKETFYRRPISIHVFSFAMILCVCLTIVADTYFASLYLIYAIRGENGENRPSEYSNPSGYFSKDSLDQRTLVENIGSYGNAMLEVYVLVNVAYITVVNPEDFVRIDDASQIGAMSFGNTLIGNNTNFHMQSVMIFD